MFTRTCSKRSGLILGSAGVFAYVTVSRYETCDVYTHLPINLRVPASNRGPCNKAEPEPDPLDTDSALLLRFLV